VVHAEWNEDMGKWQLKMETKSGIVEDECDVLVSAVGFLSKWKWPDIPGLHDFKGQLMHSASWDNSFESKDKKIGVIGNGSSAIQIIPQVVQEAKYLANFIRNPTYITPGLGSGAIGGKTQYYYTEEEKKNFRDHPEQLNQYRKKIQAASNRAFDMFVKGSEAQEQGKKATQDQMREKLGGDNVLAAKLTPDYGKLVVMDERA
jgi:cation diffusion facilitator CzcD-associated flavoprotein CzcO